MQQTEMYRKIVRLLDDAGVSYETFEHEHVHSSKDAAKVRGTKIEEAAKALVLASISERRWYIVPMYCFWRQKVRFEEDQDTLR